MTKGDFPGQYNIHNVLLFNNYCCFFAVVTRIVINMSFKMADEETEGLYLVDFTQKIIDKKRETYAQREQDNEERSSSSPVPPPENPDEEWYYLFISRLFSRQTSTYIILTYASCTLL